jgi:copper resistance protein B
MRQILLAGILVMASDRSLAQEPQTSGQTTTLPNLPAETGWPEPVSDSATFGFLLFDNTEFQRAGGRDAFRWDVFGWRGGDVHRFWVKSEGRIATASSEESEFEVQALYGTLVAPFFDLQAGVRVDQRLRPGSDPARVYAVVGLQGLSPYRFEIEPSLFLSQKGQISGRLTATYDVLLSQRLILQPRLETNVAVQRDEEIGLGAGWNDAEIGVRLRYETRREFGPYVGVTWKDRFGATHRLTGQGSGDLSHVVVVAGARAWF